MTTPRNSWEAADKAYLTHHFACPQCIAAGVTRSEPRCAVGAPLWDEYAKTRDSRQHQNLKPRS